MATRRLLAPVAALLVALAAGCGGGSAVPSGDAGAFAVKVMHLIVTTQYGQAWRDLHPDDQKVAPLAEYVACENRSPIMVRPISVRVLDVGERAVDLGNGRSVRSKAVQLRLVFPGAGNILVRTVHVVAVKSDWKWVLPARRFQDYADDACPTATAPPPTPST